MKSRQKVETEIEVPLCTLQDLMGETLWEMANNKIDGVIFQAKYEIVGFDSFSIVLKVTGHIMEDD